MQDDSFNADVFRFGRRPLIGFLTFLNAFVPLSIDLYLPALPHMGEVFDCPRSLTELTLSCFMLFFGLSMLVWGAFSDKYGRKPILNAGLFIYMAASILCIFSTSISMLIAGRILQAIGSGAICSVSMAIVKDTFKGRIMENVLVWVQTMTVLAPMLAPVAGALLLRFTSWRGLFCILLVCSLGAFVVSLSLKETMRNPTKGSGLASLGRIGAVLRNKGLRWLLWLFALSSMPFMAYLTSSSFIYISFFGLDEQQFSWFFAANAAIAMTGPILYARLFRNWNRRFYLSLCFSMMVVAGVSLFFYGARGPFWFFGCYAIITLFASSCRPLGTVLMMSQLDTDNGTVAALIGCVNLLFGSLAMMICSFDFGGPVMAVSCIAMVIGALCTLLWRYLDGKKLYRDALKQP